MGDQFDFPFEEEPEDALDDDICRNKHGGEQYSEAANEDVHPRKANQRGRIVAHLDKVGALICDQCAVQLGMPTQTCSARWSELKRDGTIVPVFGPDGKQATRPTRQGKPAGVYRLRTPEDDEAEAKKDPQLPLIPPGLQQEMLGACAECGQDEWVHRAYWRRDFLGAPHEFKPREAS